MAGLPVAVSRLVELERFVNENSVGLIMDETDPKDIARAIDEIICNPDHFRFSKAKVSDISQRYGWDVQEQRLLELYQRFSPYTHRPMPSA
jgi:glycosyltransferase involved in cell wall biosynthesis